MLLEVSQYLEKYLWPNFDDGVSAEHVLSIVTLCNEKFREGVAPFGAMEEGGGAAKFAALFQRVVALRADADRPLALFEAVQYLTFVVVAFQSLESEAVRPCVLKLVSLPLWHALSPGRLELELHRNEHLAKLWAKMAKKDAKAVKKDPAHVPARERPEARFLTGLLDDFFGMLEGAVGAAGASAKGEGGEGGAVADAEAVVGGAVTGHVRYCERFLELLVDLLSQLPTRRFVHALLEDRAVLVRCKRSALYGHAEGQLFLQLTDLLQFYLAFDINDHTGEPKTDDDCMTEEYDKVTQFQRLVFKHWPALKELALANCGTVTDPEKLVAHLGALKEADLAELACGQLRAVSDADASEGGAGLTRDALAWHFQHKPSRREQINQMPLYPSEGVLFDERQVPSTHWTGETCLALPKLNLQFLSYHDYLMRNFQLFRLESTYEIRHDLMDALHRMQPQADDDGATRFRGWARMAVPLQHFSITEVGRPLVGESKPSHVTAELRYDLSGCRQDVGAEWDDEVKQFDTMFLLTVRAPDAARLQELQAAAARAREAGEEVAELAAKAQGLGLAYVRGCEVVEVRDEEDNLMNDFTGRVRRDEAKDPVGTLRTVVVQMDTAQYQMDVDRVAESGAEDVYGTFSLLVRRRSKENNWASVLRSIRDLMNEECVLPPWLHDVFLGYGEPGQAGFHHMPDRLTTLDFVDTFLDADHVRESFPGYKVTFRGGEGGAAPQPPFRVSFPADDRPDPAVVGPRFGPPLEGERELVAEAYRPVDPGPYPQDVPRVNRVRFTPMQVEAIRAGVQPGLTMVVGPPGTGKTDTATQIINCLYHTAPDQRVLLVAHSNQALNDLFQKIIERDVPARYLLRLGMGEEELDTDLDFSRVGRVNAMLARRLELLGEVERLAGLLGAPADMAYSCETAGHFWLIHVLARWEKFGHAAKRAAAAEGDGAYSGYVKELFPFGEYFSDAPAPLFPGGSAEADLRAAEGCFRHLKQMFQELEETRPFELLKSQRDRVNYLTTKQAKVVAMTCTHAALKRHDFIRVGLQYDTLIMEESAQVLEVETFIPLLLQPSQPDGRSRLKRVVLIGDHHQLPPVVQNMAIQKYSRMDQSLFARFVRLQVPYYQLDAQGRARPSISQLYNWRYESLRDLPHTSTLPRFAAANPGFASTFQLIDIPDVDGVGESEPMPYFFQNLGEAEYVVALYQYMRLLGYPASRISILTTYNGQRALIRDVIERRCAYHPAFGRPSKVATVDKFQGQQNDYVLLSLVRSKTVGHLRDVRRLVVATSRARLGLYIVGRKDLFANCFELQPAFRALASQPAQAMLVPNERWSEDFSARREGDPVPADQCLAVQNLTQLQQMVEGMAQGAMMAAYAAQQQAQGGAGAADAAAPATAEGAEGAATPGGALGAFPPGMPPVMMGGPPPVTMGGPPPEMMGGPPPGESEAPAAKEGAGDGGRGGDRGRRGGRGGRGGRGRGKKAQIEEGNSPERRSPRKTRASKRGRDEGDEGDGEKKQKS